MTSSILESSLTECPSLRTCTTSALAHFRTDGCGTWVPIWLSPPADFHRHFNSFSLITAYRARANAAHYAVALLREATFVVHRRGWSTAIRSASQDGRMRRPPSSKLVEGKRHEMFKSRLQSPHWSCRLSAMVQQAALLFKALPRCVRGCCTKGWWSQRVDATFNRGKIR